jgi:hypothetical protein
MAMSIEPPHPGNDWFSALFGFRETGRRDVERWLRVDHEGTTNANVATIQSLVNNKVFRAGILETPTLAELRSAGATVELTGQLSVTNLVGDVAAFHASPENRHATFQVASQFNCLEFTSKAGSPEAGVTKYVEDRTQGPACAVACGPGTVLRNYFVHVEREIAAGIGAGQTKDRQLNNLASFSHAVGNDPEGSFFTVLGGHTVANDEQLGRLNPVLQQMRIDGSLDSVRDAVRVGVQHDTQVTSTDWGTCLLADWEQHVTQVFTSACTTRNRGSSRASWRHFATLVLEASYEATLWAAVLAAQRHHAGAGSCRVFLTCLGGGAFGNDLDWILDALRYALELFRNYGLHVYLVTHKTPVDSHLEELEREFAHV